MAQPVEFTSLTGIPEVQRLSETLSEDARSGQRQKLRVIFEKNLVFFRSLCRNWFAYGLFTRKGLSPLHGGGGAEDPIILFSG